MKYLLDTHALLWYFADSPELTESAAKIIEDTDVQKFVSVASLWEFTIKHSLNKLHFDGGISALYEMVVANRFSILQISETHLKQLDSLPFIHRDPFDRLIVATALADGLVIVTADENIHKYGVKCTF
jgi:PIN domain nuclease of toxin-antitoxin system